MVNLIFVNCKQHKNMEFLCQWSIFVQYKYIYNCNSITISAIIVRISCMHKPGSKFRIYHFFKYIFCMNKDQKILTSNSNMSCILFIYSYFFNVQVNLIYRTWDDSLKQLKISHLVKSRGITQEWQNTNNLWIWFGWQLSNKIPQNWITQNRNIKILKIK